ITSASITLTQVWDFNTSEYDDDQLALFLLDDAFMNNTYSTWRSITDDSVITPAGFANSLLKADSTSNLFDQLAPLVTYNVTEDISNSNSQKVDLTYNFTSADLTTLQAYLTDPTPGSSYRDIALGIDPDCHFQLDKISFTVSDNIKPVPEPATMLLMGTGLSGLIGIRRKKAQYTPST
ncbi:MAG: PEP-CTERM sorting domain-containing protein, partial [Aeromonas bestiarum]